MNKDVIREQYCYERYIMYKILQRDNTIVENKLFIDLNLDIWYTINLVKDFG